MSLVATTLVPAPVKLVGPKVVRIDHPSQVDYHVAEPVYRPAAKAWVPPVHPPIQTGPAIAPALAEVASDYMALDGTSVVVIGICSWIDYRYGTDYRKHPKHDVMYKALESWCKWHKAHYYAAPRESFSKLAAVDQARSLGLAIVVVEDLS